MMIRNQWYVILESKEVKRKPRRFLRLGEQLVLWRDNAGRVCCLVDRCCHRGVALSAGKRLKNGYLRCPFHGLEFDGKGSCRCIPANSRSAEVPGNFRIPAYPVYEDRAWIWIWWGEGKLSGRSPGEDRASELTQNARVSVPGEKPEYFPDISRKFGSYTIRDAWNAHYSRVLENQLDVVHLPFVHHNTIGLGNRTVVDGPGIQWINNRMMYAYVFNRRDDGTPPKKPAEVPVPPPQDFKLELIMPNLWENRISEGLRIVAAFVPVDDKHTLLYLRTYAGFLRIPLIGRLLGWLFGRMNRIIAHQDRRVVQTQTPRPGSLKSGEQLIQGDLPIIEYRRKREQMRHE